MMDISCHQLIVDEEKYLVNLSEFVKISKNLSKTINKDEYDLFGRIDLIYSYQAMQFYPDLTKCKTTYEFVDCFIKHTGLFTMYNDFMKVKSFIVWMKVEFQSEEFQIVNKIFVPQSNDLILEQRLKQYRMFLENINNKKIFARCSPALLIINRIFEENKQTLKQNIVFNEFIIREMLYIFSLHATREAFNKFFERHNKFAKKRHILYGKLPELCESHKLFWNSLEKCRYDLDIEDILNCFLEHKSMFQLYVEGIKLINAIEFDLIAINHEILKEDMSKDRLFKYVQFMDTFKKYCKGTRIIQKFNQVYEMLENTLIDANNVMTIREIVNENVDLDEQGELIQRGELMVLGPVKYFKANMLCLVYLFEKAMVFTSPEIKHRRNYAKYVHHFLTKYMVIQQKTTNKKSIKISNTKYFQSGDEYTFSAIDDDLDSWYLSLMKCYKLNV